MSYWEGLGQIWQEHLHLLDSSAAQLFVHTSQVCWHTIALAVQSFQQQTLLQTPFMLSTEAFATTRSSVEG